VATHFRVQFIRIYAFYHLRLSVYLRPCDQYLRNQLKMLLKQQLPDTDIRNIVLQCIIICASRQPNQAK
jgi:hypothetical protein